MGKLSLLFGLVLLTSCGTIKKSEDETSTSRKLREYEESFHPSDYDQPPKDFFPDGRGSTGRDSGNTSTVVTAQPLELTQGYRVQVFATTSYDDVTRMKTTVEGQFKNEWFYIVYDAPTYKLRAGNFIERYEADRFTKLLAEKGYKTSWVVPERV